MPNTLVKNLAKNLVKNLAKNPDELEMNTPQIWSKTWVPGRIRNELWVRIKMNPMNKLKLVVLLVIAVN